MPIGQTFPAGDSTWWITARTSSATISTTLAEAGLCPQPYVARTASTMRSTGTPCDLTTRMTAFAGTVSPSGSVTCLSNQVFRTGITGATRAVRHSAFLSSWPPDARNAELELHLQAAFASREAGDVDGSGVGPLQDDGLDQGLQGLRQGFVRLGREQSCGHPDEDLVELAEEHRIATIVGAELMAAARQCPAPLRPQRPVPTCRNRSSTRRCIAMRLMSARDRRGDRIAQSRAQAHNCRRVMWRPGWPRFGHRAYS